MPSGKIIFLHSPQSNNPPTQTGYLESGAYHVLNTLIESHQARSLSFYDTCVFCMYLLMLQRLWLAWYLPG